MFEKLVAIEPVNLTQEAKEQLGDFAKDTVFYDTLPENDSQIVERIGNADAVLVSYTSQISGQVIQAAPNLRYIGMCCSLYSEASANVDIAAARDCGVTVTGVRDYGDEGVVEFVISELARYLHGFGGVAWKPGCQMEIASLRCGIVGLGTTGIMIADALRWFGADVSYFSRTRKPEQEAKGVTYLPLNDLLAECDAVFTCLNKNVVLLGEDQFEALGMGKILFNTSIAPGHEVPALGRWLERGSMASPDGSQANAFFCDTVMALSTAGQAEPLLESPYVHCAGMSSGSTVEACVRLSKKVLANIQAFLDAE